MSSLAHIDAAIERAKAAVPRPTKDGRKASLDNEEAATLTRYIWRVATGAYTMMHPDIPQNSVRRRLAVDAGLSPWVPCRSRAMTLTTLLAVSDKCGLLPYVLMEKAHAAMRAAGGRKTFKRPLTSKIDLSR